MKILRPLPLLAILFVVALPNSEALKNLIWVCILLCLPAALKLRFYFGRHVTILEGLLGFIFAVTLMSAVQSDYPQLAWKGVVDSLMFVSISWYFYVVFGHNSIATSVVVRAVFWATFIGVLLGLRDYLVGGVPHIELRSVGIVTHSAIYVGMAILAMYAYLVFDKTSITTRGLRSFEVTGLVLTLVMFLIMGSRGAILGFAVGAGFIVFRCVWGEVKDFQPLKHLAIVCMLIASTVVIPDIGGHSRLWEKSNQLVFGAQMNGGDRHRFALWELGLAAFFKNDSKLLGTGPRTFGQINLVEHHEVALSLNPKEGKIGHAHNLFLNKLVEEGALGALAMAGFFFFVFRRSTKGGVTPEKLGVLGAMTVSIVGGFFNTPFIQEQAVLLGILASLLMSGDLNAIAQTKED